MSIWPAMNSPMLELSVVAAQTDNVQVKRLQQLLCSHNTRHALPLRYALQACMLICTLQFLKFSKVEGLQGL